MKVGQLIREGRERAKLTQAELADKIGCTVGYVAHLEHGRSLPSELKLLQLCDALKLDKREAIRTRQLQKASKQAQPYYEDTPGETVFFRDGHKLRPDQVALALKVIRAVEKNPDIRTAINVILRGS